MKNFGNFERNTACAMEYGHYKEVRKETADSVRYYLIFYYNKIKT